MLLTEFAIFSNQAAVLPAARLLALVACILSLSVFLLQGSTVPQHSTLFLNVSGNSVGSESVLMLDLRAPRVSKWHERLSDRLINNEQIIGISGSATNEPLIADVQETSKEPKHRHKIKWLAPNGSFSSELEAPVSVDWSKAGHVVLSPNLKYLSCTYQDPPRVPLPFILIISLATNTTLYISHPPQGAWDVGPSWSPTSESLLYTRTRVVSGQLAATILRYDLSDKAERVAILDDQFVSRATFIGGKDRLVGFGPRGLTIFEQGKPVSVLCPLSCFADHVYMAGGIVYSEELDAVYIPFSDQKGGSTLYAVSVKRRDVRQTQLSGVTFVRSLSLLTKVKP